jgi:hypothetical protein
MIQLFSYNRRKKAIQSLGGFPLKNIQTGNQISVVSIPAGYVHDNLAGGHWVGGVSAYLEVIDPKSYILSSVESSGSTYFASLISSGLDQVTVTGEASIDDALLALEEKVELAIGLGDDTLTPGMWHSPQTLGI